jgi:hypothetical protein
MTVTTGRAVFVVERLRYQFVNWTGGRCLPHGDEGAEAVYRRRPLIFDSVAAIDVLLFSFLKQVSSGGHTNSHGHPHFSTIGDQVGVRVRAGR